MRNNVFQNSISLANWDGELDSLSWLQACIPWHRETHFTHCSRQRGYPSDLIQFWENQQFISTLARNLQSSVKNGSPTFKFDSLYTEILTGPENLVLRFLLSTEILLPRDVSSVLRLFRLTYRVFAPFLAFRDRLEFPFPEGDSPIDFVTNPDRAEGLFMDLGESAEILVLWWIRRAREVLDSGDFWLDP